MSPDEVRDSMAWYDGLRLGVEGQGWSDVEYDFDRLPERARGVLPKKVWAYSKHTAGMCIRFRTDSPDIAVRWRLRYHPRTSHMSPTGLSGVDLYALGDSGWGWVATGYPEPRGWCQAQLLDGPPPGLHDYRLYLPLFAGVRAVHIGIRENYDLHPGSEYQPERRHPLCFYGTSLTQGASASRPGVAYPAILGRWFDTPIINLGFSGAGKMDFPMADLLAELDASLYVLDCTANMSPAAIEERTVPFVERLHAIRPDTPILLAACPPYQNAWFLPRKYQQYIEKNDALREAFESLARSGVIRMGYVSAPEYGGDDTESSVGNHTTDLGFMRIAEAHRSHISELLGLDFTETHVAV